MPQIIQDDFTKRLLIIHLEIIKRGEQRRKKDFTDALNVTGSFYWQIEHKTRNFPSGKRKNAVAQLLDLYGVNPAFLNGSADTHFVREARPLKNAVNEAAVKINFANKEEKQALLQRVADLEEELHQVKEQLAAYQVNNPDKTDLK